VVGTPVEHVVGEYFICPNCGVASTWKQEKTKDGIVMKTEDMKAHWNEAKEGLKNFFHNVKDEDLEVDGDDVDAVIERVSRRLDTSKEEAKEMIDFAVNGKLDLEDKWRFIKGVLKKEYGDLTDDDLTMVSGDKDQTIARLQEKLNIGRDELERKFWNVVKSENK
jgi:uncharacterized protein YjbJ (UPF0337 family)